MADEDELFAEAMGRVQPLAASKKIEPESLKSGRKRPRLKPVRTAKLVISPASHAPATTDDPWQLVADGVSRERLRRLASGHLPVEFTLDLHGVTRDEALLLLAGSLEAMLTEGRRVARIIHGRGLHSQGKPVLKEAVYRWLREGPLAHAVLAAVAEPGSGGGACLLLLRKVAHK
ncbi:DNA-nicking endonuclease, Smr domain [Mariprofundus ferrinatatus]|uniref:DNA-nicking endonuclease, Smr domain n=1 Tax=Mariprofundus ferrinatatus TaxID=1921087 RepID=A0A2K8L788_9PROT|nr:Smr/MutS family protein [Mariprofundus ferrinatatus]ATX83002.1 DNA-nicking endonuclease, Smr domain [Mariprofundus ferrinatatus]